MTDKIATINGRKPMKCTKALIEEAILIASQRRQIAASYKQGEGKANNSSLKDVTLPVTRGIMDGK
jgi:hypothetical protein